MEDEKNKLTKTYGKLGQILDGLWFLEVEKELGFKAAYEIDEKVWARYSRKEAKRLKNHLDIDQVTIDDCIRVFNLTLFNQSLTYEIDRVKENPHILRCNVTKCKTYNGMEYVKRPKDQIYKVCEGIGLVFFRNMLDELIPGTTVNCISCPYHPQNDSLQGKDFICVWEFKFPEDR